MNKKQQEKLLRLLLRRYQEADDYLRPALLTSLRDAYERYLATGAQ